MVGINHQHPQNNPDCLIIAATESSPVFVFSIHLPSGYTTLGSSWHRSHLKRVIPLAPNRSLLTSQSWRYHSLLPQKRTHTPRRGLWTWTLDGWHESPAIGRNAAELGGSSIWVCQKNCVESCSPTTSKDNPQWIQIEPVFHYIIQYFSIIRIYKNLWESPCCSLWCN